MPSYFYIAKNTLGQTVTGTREAKDEHDLAGLLRQENLYLVRVDVLHSADRSPLTSRSFSLVSSILNRVGARDLIFFARNLAVMVGAGMPVLRSLEVLEQQSESRTFQIIIQEIAEAVRQGVPLSEAIGRQEKTFGPIFKNMIAAGESSGKLPESLKVLERQIRRNYELTKKIKGAMYYPAIIIVAMIGIAILMLIYVVPTLVETFRDLKIELPLSTRVIIYVSESLVTSSFFVLGGLIVVAGGIISFMRTPSGKRVLSWLLLRLPIFRDLNKKLNLARFSRTLGSLIGSGVPILEALGISASVLRNPYYSQALLRVREGVEKGENLSHALGGFEKLFPPLFVQMVNVGEETGKVGGMLLTIALFYESEVAQMTKNLSTLIEPIMMIFIGTAVGFFAVSILQPIYSVVGGI